jgi:hypothetical protein
MVRDYGLHGDIILGADMMVIKDTVNGGHVKDLDISQINMAVQGLTLQVECAQEEQYLYLLM